MWTIIIILLIVILLSLIIYPITTIKQTAPTINLTDKQREQLKELRELNQQEKQELKIKINKRIKEAIQITNPQTSIEIKAIELYIKGKGTGKE